MTFYNMMFGGAAKKPCKDPRKTHSGKNGRCVKAKTLSPKRINNLNRGLNQKHSNTRKSKKSCYHLKDSKGRPKTLFKSRCRVKCPGNKVHVVGANGKVKCAGSSSRKMSQKQLNALAKGRAKQASKRQANSNAMHNAATYFNMNTPTNNNSGKYAAMASFLNNTPSPKPSSPTWKEVKSAQKDEDAYAGMASFLNNTPSPKRNSPTDWRSVKSAQKDEEAYAGMASFLNNTPRPRGRRVKMKKD